MVRHGGMRRKVRQEIAKLEAETELLLSRIEEYPQETLLRKPAPGSWSALQALNHIYLGEQLSLRYVKYKLDQGVEPPRLRPDAWVRSLALTWVLRSRMRYKSPKPINMHADQPVLQICELRTAWTTLRQEMAQLLENHESRLQWRMAYKHPYVGRMTLLQMLRFFREHLRHHNRQIQDILSKTSNAA